MPLALSSFPSLTALAGLLDYQSIDSEPTIDGLRRQIASGGDPLGEMFTQCRSSAERRPTGTVLTPPAVVDAMIDWAASAGAPARIVDPGAGTGRFLLACAKKFPRADLLAFENDETAARLLLANAHICGLVGRLRVETGDFLEAGTGPRDPSGPTLFLGNPPWVRHHGIPRDRKDLAAQRAAGLGLPFSRLAGLYVHFMLAICRLARPGDYGAMLLPAEWLHTGYGSTLRTLFSGGPLGLLSLHVVDSGIGIFPDTQASAAIACFHAGPPAPAPRFTRIVRSAGLDLVRGGTTIPLERFAQSQKWSALDRPQDRPASKGRRSLGDLFDVHRGIVTGANRVWIAGPHTGRLPPRLLLPAVTRARDLLDAPDGVLAPASLRKVVVLPESLDGLSDAEAETVMEFLRHARAQGAHLSWTARHRHPWWRLRLRRPAPVLCTYMARRPPVFVRNRSGAAHLNIAHGLYPRTPINDGDIDDLLAWLNRHVRLDDGRCYAGGLIKFEPSDISCLSIPHTHSST